ncbi:Putative glycosyltransferase EpsD [Frondihabitans sp. 762G35]|uniref:glycosyltransferase family 4 protein n=1 Tax=Frondihabitans sp. 762G35 TaxID=1446794 RepID=UPI000D21152F|nr:glycosyltransferase family 4 protein [Frondihabitans sp. 762G35]ARC57716.1 Putative glycosyltransferase EpsD [Frondihabitans sp. 762G35]
MLDVLFPHETDLDAWRDAFQRGRTPGEWPHGLEALREVDPAATVGSLSEPTLGEKVRGRILPRRRPLLAGGARRGGIGLTWDENAGRRLALREPRQTMVTGVQWITDIVREGRDPGRMREVLRALDGLWVTSRGQVDALRAFVGDDGPRIAYFRAGVDSDFFRAEPFPSGDAPLVVSAGLDRHRDLATLYAAVEIVRDRMPWAQFVVQDEGSAGAAVPRGVTTFDRLDPDELRDLHSRAWCFANATGDNLHASGHVVALEAMAVGRAVVLTRTPGIEDYVDDGRTGFLVPVGDAEALAERLLRTLEDRSLAVRLGQAARRSVEEDLTLRHFVDRLAGFALSVAGLSLDELVEDGRMGS